jgi:hypothetical protein
MFETKDAADVARDPLSYHWLTYLWVAFVAVWGGLVRLLREIRNGTDKSPGQLVIYFCAELATSGFVGVMTFYGCELAGFQPLNTAILTGTAGYMGGRALTVFEAAFMAVKARKPINVVVEIPDDKKEGA